MHFYLLHNNTVLLGIPTTRVIIIVSPTNPNPDASCLPPARKIFNNDAKINNDAKLGIPRALKQVMQQAMPPEPSRVRGWNLAEVTDRALAVIPRYAGLANCE